MAVLETPRASHRVRVRRTPLTWLRGGGLSNLLFAVPLLFVFGAFSWWPIVQAIVMSFQKTNLVTPALFVGLDNFARVLGDPLFLTAVRNTGYFALLALFLGYPVPLVVAVLLSEVRRWKGLFSALAYLPVVVPPVVAEVLLRCQPHRGVQRRARLARNRASTLDPVRGIGDALPRA
jgi:multiple sugar transport system permease protein